MPARYRLGDRVHDLATRTLVMGILNRTPDSFYDHGATFALDAFLRRADEHRRGGRRHPRRRWREGRARCRRVGGRGARPRGRADRGAARRASTSPSRVTRGGRRCSTRRAAPARSSATTSAASATPTTCGSRRSTGRRSWPPTSGSEPRVADPEPHYDDLLGDVTAFLLDRAGAARGRRARRRSRSRSTPGSTSARRPAQSAVLLRESDALASHGYALLLSASNKRFLGELLDARRSTSAVPRRWRRWRTASRTGAASCGCTTSPGAPRCAA